MQPDVLNSTGIAPYTAAEMKAVFRAGWSNPQRVEGWVKSGLNAEFFDEECREGWKWALEHAVRGVPDGPVLDIGCGPGTIAMLWADLGFATTGMDFSPTMLEMAGHLSKERGLRLTLIEGDAEAPPFRKNQFSIISSRFVLFTLPHPGLAIRRWIEMLEPGGALVIIGHEFSVAPEKSSAPDERVGWKMGDDYRKALDQLPFLDHKPGHLQVVLEAAGLRDITRLPLDHLLEMRSQFSDRHEGAMRKSTPYLYVGRK